MQTEIEAKFLSVDHEAMRTRLRELGAVCVQPERLMRRKNYDFADMSLEKKAGWVRVRDEGDKVTISYKQMNDRTLHGTKEVCVTVDNFDQADALLEAIGLRTVAYQETKRESWKLGDAEIELDEWPWARPFLEIEAPDETAVRDLAEKLGCDWKDALHGSVEVVYIAEYDVTEPEIYLCPEITFSPVPEWLAVKKRAA